MSHWFLTTKEIALASTLLGAPIGALITVFAQRSSNHANLNSQRELSAANLEAQKKQSEETLEAQRALASDERLFEKRAEFYPDLIERIVRFQGSVNRRWRNHAEAAQLTSAITEHRASMSSLQVPMVAWAGQPIRDEWHPYVALVREIERQFATLSDREGGSREPALTDEFARILEQLTERTRHLAQALRAELIR